MSSTAITMPTPPLFDEARLAVAGFLARYSGPTRKSYVSDLRQFFAWCASVDLEVFATKRGHIELWARSMEEKVWLGPPSGGGYRRWPASTGSACSTA